MNCYYSTLLVQREENQETLFKQKQKTVVLLPERNGNEVREFEDNFTLITTAERFQT